MKQFYLAALLRAGWNLISNNWSMLLPNELGTIIISWRSRSFPTVNNT